MLQKTQETAAYRSSAQLQGESAGGVEGLNREAGDGGQRRDALGRVPIQLQAAVQPWFPWRH